jgi:L-malate glycosyltransferase
MPRRILNLKTNDSPRLLGLWNMKVCMLTTSYKGDFGGNPIHNLSRDLVGKGVEVVVLVPYKKGTNENETIEGVKVRRFHYFWPTSYERLIFEGALVDNLKRSAFAMFQAPLFAISMTVNLFALARREKIDVIHSHWIVPCGFAGALMKALFGYRHVMTLQGSDVFYLKKVPFSGIIANFVLERVDVTVSLSKYLKETLEGIAGRKCDIQVFPMGVEIRDSNPGKNKAEERRRLGIDSKVVLLYVGSFREKKGVEYLIKAMPKIFEEHMDASLVLVGDGPLRGRILEMVRDSGCEDKVKFIGQLPHEEIRPYYAASDLVIVPSIVDRYGETEGMPNVVLEAMSAGKPVLGTKVSGIPDIVVDGYNGLLVNPESPEGISEGVLRLLRGDDLERLGQGAYETASRFSQSNITDKYISIYRATLEKKS